MTNNSEANLTLATLAASILEDFHLLIASLAQQIDGLDDLPPETLAALGQAKFAAERGLRLSERLSKSINGETA